MGRLCPALARRRIIARREQRGQRAVQHPGSVNPHYSWQGGSKVPAAIGLAVTRGFAQSRQVARTRGTGRCEMTRTNVPAGKTCFCSDAEPVARRRLPAARPLCRHPPWD